MSKYRIPSQCPNCHTLTQVEAMEAILIDDFDQHNGKTFGTEEEGLAFTDSLGMKGYVDHIYCTTCGYVLWRAGETRVSRFGRKVFRERVPVIRGLQGEKVQYRYFGESYGMKKSGYDLYGVEGFKGTGQELANQLGIDVEELAVKLQLPVDEVVRQEFDVSRN